MYTLYQKVEKRPENEFGIKQVTSETPFGQPIFLSLLALNDGIKATNGSINRILELAGVRKPNGEENLPLDEQPITYMGLMYSEESNERIEKCASGDNSQRISEDTRSFTIKNILPLLSKDGKKRNTIECCRNMRNINIMCYCDALYMISSMNKVLIEEMINLQFTQEEINEILSQICILSIGAEYGTLIHCLKDLKFTSIIIADAKDSFGMNDKAREYIFSADKEVYFNAKDLFKTEDERKNEKNSRVLCVNDDGEHSLKTFIHKGIAFPAMIIEITNAILNNSLINNSAEYKPINETLNKTIPEIIEACLEQERLGISKDEMTQNALKKITYSNKKKY